MIVRYCDRCTANLTDRSFVSMSNDLGGQCDLCTECYDKFRIWMDEK